MSAPTSTTNSIPGRLLANCPDIASNTTSDDDDLVNEDGSTVEVPRSGAKFEISVETGFGNLKHPVHENLTIAAAIRSKTFNNDNSWSNLRLTTLPASKYELIRGVFYNDDPNCTLFEDLQDNNRSMSLALAAGYGAQFTAAKLGADKSGMLYRSHFGNLQFIHAMGSDSGEPPSETQRKIKLWLQTMYFVYSGQNGVKPDTALKVTGLNEFFKDSNMTFKQLLMARTPSYRNPDIALRALGSCMHVVQDSYAKGHCRREDNGTDAIANFHCYNGQDDHAHSQWDSEGGGKLDPQDLNTFNGLFGGRTSITRCIEFLDAAAAKLPWNDKLEGWFQETFAISPNAKNSDTSI